MILLDARRLPNNCGDHDVGGDYLVWRDIDPSVSGRPPRFQALGDRVALEPCVTPAGIHVAG
jgi:hypothetical protein